MSNPKHSWVWSYYAVKGKLEAVCEICKRVINRSKGSTSGMRNHLKVHGIVADASDHQKNEISIDMEDSEPTNEQPRLNPETPSSSTECPITEYLTRDESVKGRGFCKLCNTSVLWNRQKLASHKRKNCELASEEERKFFAKPPPSTKKRKPIFEDKNWKVADFLVNYQSATCKGTCMGCKKPVQWSQGRVASHLKYTCTNIASRKKLIAVSRGDKSPKLLEQPAQQSNLKSCCYICRIALGTTTTRLVHTLEFTSTLLFEVLGEQNMVKVATVSLNLIFILESMTSTDISKEDLKASAVCGQCSKQLNEYDEFQFRSQQIQTKINKTFINARTGPAPPVKKEPEFHCEDVFAIAIEEKSFNGSSDDDDQEEREDEEARFVIKEVKVRKDVKSIPARREKNVTSPPVVVHHKCDLCYSRFLSPLQVEFHMIAEHIENDGTFQCPICPKTFMNKRSFSHHSYVHNRSWICPM